MELAAHFVIVEVSGFSSGSNDLAVNLAASFASVVSRPAIEGSVDLPIEFAEVVFLKDLDVVSGVIVVKAVFFVAVFAVVRIDRLVEGFVESVDVSFGPRSVLWESSSDSLKVYFCYFTNFSILTPKWYSITSSRSASTSLNLKPSRVMESSVEKLTVA